jgi:hypothetical protein
LLAFWPVQPWHEQSTSAFFNYSTRWELNDSIFRIILWISQGILQLVYVDPGYGQHIARIIVVLTTLWGVIYLTSKRGENDMSLYRSALILISFIFMISPTQFPWYAIWLLPFLTVQPRFSLLLLTPLLTIYYLRYYFQLYQREILFDNYLVWLQYIPVWALIIMEWRRGKWKISKVNEKN